MKKRNLHIDLQGTLLTRSGKATVNGPLIAHFAQAAAGHNIVVNTVTYSYVDHDDQLAVAYPEEAGLLMGTLDKGQLSDATWDAINAGDHSAKTHDVIIDDDPDVQTDELGFENFANIWIDPNSQTLIDDLKAVAKEELGFEWQPPELNA